MTTRYHIALTFTDSYWALAYTAMRSISITSRRPQTLQFHLCHEELSVEHIQALDSVAEEFGVEVNHHDLAQREDLHSLAEILRTNSRFPPIVYARLLLDQILPKDVRRVLYLDCDTMVLEDISGLFETDLEGSAIAAVRDPNQLHLKLGRDLRARRHLFTSAEPYFNSGVMLIDLQALAKANVTLFARELSTRVNTSELYFDQDLLNLIFVGAWKELDWRYNLTGPRPPHTSLAPAILHYTRRPSPWNLGARVAYARLYRHMMTNRIFYLQLKERWRKNVFLYPISFLLPS